MKAIALAIVLFAGINAAAQVKSDEAAIRGILDEEIATWNRGDAEGYAKHFAANGTFTNIRGLFYTGRQEYRDRHEVIFKGPFHGTKLELRVVSLRFPTPDVAICETLTWVSGFASGAPPFLHLDAKGRLRTRLLQVMARRDGDWQIIVYHNVDVKPDVETPEPR
ncbi:MAG TPA: SgcJ/EcaC family oxidoreductase [Terracidiphilus sp.]|nr:SgcJ/EcaC family oxidoreductase [Terracidiphilus sp.]